MSKFFGHLPPGLLKLSLMIAIPVGIPLLVLVIIPSLSESQQFSQRSAVALAALEDIESLRMAVEQANRVLVVSAVHDEPGGGADLAPTREALTRVSTRLLNMPIPDDIRRDVRDVLQLESDLYAVSVARPASVQALFETSDALSEKLKSLTDVSGRMMAWQVRELLVNHEDLQRRFAVTALAIFPVGIVLAVLLCVVLLMRPFKDLGLAIRNLGNGDLKRPVAITGPELVRSIASQLNWLRSRLESVQSQRELLACSVGHDLKTPLASIVEGIELLRQAAPRSLDSQELQEVVGIMRDSASLLKEKIETLVTTRSADVDAGLMETRPLDMMALASLVAKRHQLVCRARDIRVVLGGQGGQVLGDRARLTAILDNLFANAIRFSPPGGTIEVNVQTLGSLVQVVVADDGPGISPAEAPHIFTVGYRSRVQQEYLVAGSGVGLSIAAEFARAHGGALKLCARNSTALAGAHFCLVLPHLTSERSGCAASACAAELDAVCS